MESFKSASQRKLKTAADYEMEIEVAVVSVMLMEFVLQELRVGATDPKKRPFCNAFTGEWC